ncbi:hypothetical protein [Nitrosomonas sp. Nm166]|uniref:hypothetical protein n=1 Tax=Nitrosomonas sp. Nm166 TaxID=1881054 RepID=UPI0008F36536|nr:hypothetical protein [Nitrosomonas sp. Nm166]SFF13677.1 hypothetical protein SAMN05428977_105418 [Nitrosomonas sp. Nm166]
MILSPYFWLAALIFVLLTAGGGYVTGYKHAREYAAAQQLQAVEKARQEAIEQAKRDQQTAQKYESARETVRTVYVKIKEKAHENIKNHPDYDRCELDPVGLQLYNARPPDAQDSTGSTDRRVSGSAERTGRQALDNPSEQPGASADVLRLPGTPQSIVGMGGHITVGANIFARRTNETGGFCSGN